MKRLMLFFLILIMFSFICPYMYSNSLASSIDEIEEQQKEYGIQDFLKNSKKYIGETFDDVNIDEVLEDAIKGEVDNSSLIHSVVNLFGKEVTSSIKVIGSILVIIVIHSILKSISDSLENQGISKLIYYVQFILIITIIMTNFSDIVKMVQDTTVNLVAFMNMLVPLLITLMISTGSIATSGILEPVILFTINFIGNMIQNFIIPLILIFTSLIIISKLSESINIDKLTKFLKSGVVWFLGIVLTVFVGIVSLEGTMSSSVDGITAKTTKAVVSSAIPVVGKILGDAVDTVLRWRYYIKKCSGNCWCNNYYRDLYCPNYKIRNTYSYI